MSDEMHTCPACGIEYADDVLMKLRAENAALLKDDALLALKLAIDDTRIVAERLEAERDALYQMLLDNGVRAIDIQTRLDEQKEQR